MKYYKLQLSHNHSKARQMSPHIERIAQKVDINMFSSQSVFVCSYFSCSRQLYRGDLLFFLNSLFLYHNEDVPEGHLDC